MVGVSLSPRLFWPERQNDCDRKLLAECGGVAGLLRFLRGLGVAYIELRPVEPTEDPAAVLACAQAIWDGGLKLTVHGAMPKEIGPFAQTCPSLLPLLGRAKEYQSLVTITLHSYTTGDDGDVAPAVEKTRQLLKTWGSEADRYGFRLALELNRDKHNGDPSVTPRGVLTMLEDSDPDAVGICFDFGHYYSNVRTYALGEDALPDKRFLERVIHTHIHALGGNGGTHFPLDAAGKLPLDHYVGGLSRAGYGGIYNVELEFARIPEQSFRQAIRDSVVALKGALYRTGDALEQQRSAAAAAAKQQYPAALEKMAKELTQPQACDGFYTFCASGQIFRVGGVNFAVDPMIRTSAATEQALEQARAVLAQVGAIFITHAHDDHFDPEFAKKMADLDCTWVVDHTFPQELLTQAGLRQEKLCFVKPGDKLELPGITAQVFPGCHFQSDGTGIEAVMYLLTVGGRTVFLPADVRDYGADKLPMIEAPDCMIANVWLGRGQACRTEDGAYEEFCDYVAYFKPKKVFLGHLMEYAREVTDLWRWEHAGRVMDGLQLRLPESGAMPLRLFEYYRF